MLRRFEQGKKKLEVIPVDSGMSEWRTMWVPDTVEADGVKWLKQNNGGKGDVLLLVYPNTGEDFTSKMIKAYGECFVCSRRRSTCSTDNCSAGTTIVSAGSQNTSGFTGFASETIADWMSRELPDLGEGASDTSSELCWQGRGALVVFEKRS